MEHVDVLIIGAGISGIGMGCRLRMHDPDRSFAIVEARDDIGGTWDLFRYPGIRSDSDMYSFGYDFRPWSDERDIATGDAILRYLNDTVDEYDLRRSMRFGQRVSSVSWSSSDRRWTIQITPSQGEPYAMTCRFLVGCTGYYDYRAGYMPDFPGKDTFEGQLVHPQLWPDDLDHAGKRVVVIGSGATAVTLVPAMAQTAAHVTMLQRSPSYIYSRPSRDRTALLLKRVLPQRAAHRIIRLKNITLFRLLYWRSKKTPDKVRAWFKQRVADVVGPAVDVETHFDPPYDPWAQRLCLIPDDDLFLALRDGSASMVTDRIERFTPDGIQLKSGQHLDADIIVSATGLQLQFLGGATMSIDGQQQSSREQVSYRGMMFANIPNWVQIIGYTGASWTLKADLTAGWVCRLLKHMDANGYEVAVPRRSDADLPQESIMANLADAGYVRRADAILPRQGPTIPWRNQDGYFHDYVDIAWGRVDDGVMRFD